MENSVDMPQKLKNTLPYNSAIQLWSLCLKGRGQIIKNVLALLCLLWHFQPMCQSMKEWIKKWYTYTQ